MHAPGGGGERLGGFVRRGGQDGGGRGDGRWRLRNMWLERRNKERVVEGGG